MLNQLCVIDEHKGDFGLFLYIFIDKFEFYREQKN